jgi:hypothetical protein
LSIAADLKKAVHGAATALLPQDCFLCAAPSGDRLLCPSCATSLPRLTAERCPVCALPTPGSNTCGACLKQAPHFDATQAVFRYEFPLDRLIQELRDRSAGDTKTRACADASTASGPRSPWPGDSFIGRSSLRDREYYRGVARLGIGHGRQPRVTAHRGIGVHLDRLLKRDAGFLHDLAPQRRFAGLATLDLAAWNAPAVLLLL